MVLTRKMKANGITEEDNIAVNTLIQLHKDNSILAASFFWFASNFLHES